MRPEGIQNARGLALRQKRKRVLALVTQQEAIDSKLGEPFDRRLGGARVPGWSSGLLRKTAESVGDLRIPEIEIDQQNAVA